MERPFLRPSNTHATPDGSKLEANIHNDGMTGEQRMGTDMHGLPRGRTRQKCVNNGMPPLSVRYSCRPVARRGPVGQNKYKRQQTATGRATSRKKKGVPGREVLVLLEKHQRAVGDRLRLLRNRHSAALARGRVGERRRFRFVSGEQTDQHQGRSIATAPHSRHGASTLGRGCTPQRVVCQSNHRTSADCASGCWCANTERPRDTQRHHQTETCSNAELFAKESARGDPSSWCNFRSVVAAADGSFHPSRQAQACHNAWLWGPLGAAHKIDHLECHHKPTHQGCDGVGTKRVSFLVHSSRTKNCDTNTVLDRSCGAAVAAVMPPSRTGYCRCCGLHPILSTGMRTGCELLSWPPVSYVARANLLRFLRGKHSRSNQVAACAASSPARAWTTSAWMRRVSVPIAATLASLPTGISVGFF